MKKVIGSVATVTVLVIGSYFVTGIATEKTIKNNVELFDASNGVSVRLADYQRGFFASHAKFACQMQMPEHFVKDKDGQSVLVPAKIFAYDVPVTIYHGPIMMTPDGLHFGLGYANTKVNMPERYAVKFKEEYTDQSVLPALNLKMLVTFLNKMKLYIDVPAFHLIAKQDNSALEWVGMDSEHYFSSDMKSVEGEFNIQGVKLTQEKETAVVDKVDFTYDMHRTDTGLYVGDVSFNVPSVQIKQNDEIEFEVKTLQAASSSEVEKGLFDSSFHLSFEKVVSNDKQFGPGRLTFDVKNLDADALVSINQKINDMQHSKDAQAQKTAAIAILPDLPKLFSKGARIEISEMNVVGPEGEIDGNIYISLPSEEGVNPFQMIQKTEGEGKIKMPVTFLKALFAHAEKTKLTEASLIQTDANVKTQQEQPDVKTASSTNNTQISEEKSAQPVAGAPVASMPEPASAEAVASTKALSSEDIDKQAEALAIAHVNQMLKSGLIVEQDNYYQIAVKLSAGQISVNGHPLTAEMMKF